MTVSTTSNRVIYRGNGAATNFAVPFKVLDEDHLVVRRRIFATGAFEHTYIGTDYSYSGIGDSSGTLTLSGTALADTYELVIERIVPFTQDLDIVNAGGFYPDTVEEQLDLMVMSDQQLDDIADRALLVPEGETGLIIPREADRLGKFLAFDADGDPTASTGAGGGDTDLRTDLAATTGATLVGTADGDSVQSRLISLNSSKATNADLDVEEAARIAADAALDADVTALQTAIATGTAADVDVRFATKALMDADLAHAADTVAWVYADADPALNDLYIKTGASGAGSWSATGIFGGAAEALVQPIADAAAASAAAALVSENNAATSETNAAASATSVAGRIGDGRISELPANPIDGQVERWITGEVITWDDGMDRWLVADGKPFATVDMRFDGDAGQAIGSYYEIDHFHVDRDFVTRMAPTRVTNANFFVLNGDGTASQNGSTSSSTVIISGAMHLPPGCNDYEGHFDVIAGADGNSNPRHIRTDGDTTTVIEVQNNLGELRISDHKQGSVTLLTRQHIAIPGYSNATNYRIHFRFDGHIVKAWEPISGVEISAASSLGAGHVTGLACQRADAKFGELVIYPRDLNGGVTIGDMRFVGSRSLVALPDCDALNGLDMGDYALFAAVTSTNVNSGAAAVQGPAKIQLFRREKSDGAITFLVELDWNTDQTTSDRITKIEGICVFLVGGVVHVVAADQGAGRIMLYRAPNPADLAAVGKWPRVELSTQRTYNAQTIDVLDLGDGEVRLFCTYEGSQGLTGMDNGGITTYKYNGGNSLTKANWTEVALVAAPGAWGTPKGGPVVDLLGDGRRLFVFTCRDGFRNTDGLGGIFYIDLDEGAGPDTGGKTLETIRSAGEDSIMIDLFDNGDGHGMDICYSDLAVDTVNILTRDSAWAKSTFALAVTDELWNVWNSGHRRNGKSVLLAVLGEPTGGGLYAMSESDAGGWEYEILLRQPYGHPFDKSVLYRFEMRNGLYEWIGGDSGGNFGRAYTLKTEGAIDPIAAPAIVTVYEAEAQAVFDYWATATVTPNNERLEIENTFVKEAKAAGSAWTKIKGLWLPACHAELAMPVNWKTPAEYALAASGATTFVVDQGVAGDGATGFYDTQMDLGVDAEGMSIDDMGAGSVRMADGGATTPDIGALNGALFVAGRSQTNGAGRISRTTSNLIFASTANNLAVAPYHVHSQRTGAAAETLDSNGIQKVSTTNASSALADKIYLLRSASVYSAARVGAAYVGVALTAAERLAFSLALQRRMAAVTGL